MPLACLQLVALEAPSVAAGVVPLLGVGLLGLRLSALLFSWGLRVSSIRLLDPTIKKAMLTTFVVQWRMILHLASYVISLQVAMVLNILP